VILAFRETYLTEDHLLAPLIRRWNGRAALSEEDVRAIEALPCNRRSFPRNAYVVREGSAPHNCTLLLSGFAYRHKIIRDGARQILSIHIASEFVDLQNCLLGHADHSVQTLGPAEVALIPKAALVALSASHPAIGRAMWLDTLLDAAIFREWVVNLGRRDAKARIAHLICELAARMDANGPAGDGTYHFPLTQEQLGDATGLTSVHTNRILQTLRREGLINLRSHSLEVLDPERLRAVGDFNDSYLHRNAA
jgi:CRP-like cAMP-binding protein